MCGIISVTTTGQQQDQRTRENIVKRRLVTFHRWLLDQKGYTEKTNSTYYNAIRSFYAIYNIVL